MKHRLALLTAAGLLFSLLTPAAHAFLNPPIEIAPQGVEYMCGGQGSAESAFMQMVAPQWAVALEFGISQGRRGEFGAPAQVRVVDQASGRLALEAQARGPFLLARLAPGSYEVEATLGELTLMQSITVAAGAPARAVFMWPSNYDLQAQAPVRLAPDSVSQMSTPRSTREGLSR